jgi:hypothetical protein
MGRYFFHVKRGRVSVLDQDGVELRNVVDAKGEAARRAQNLMEAVIVVADDNWQPLFEWPELGTA